MKFYIDDSFCCHTSNPDGYYREFDIQLFDSKCPEFIEGYRYIPVGESWTGPDGTVFRGEMAAPWKSYSELDDAQFAYELEKISEYSAALCEIEAAIKSADAKGTIDTFVDARKEAILSRIDDMIEALMTMEVEPIEE